VRRVWLDRGRGFLRFGALRKYPVGADDSCTHQGNHNQRNSQPSPAPVGYHIAILCMNLHTRLSPKHAYFFFQSLFHSSSYWSFRSAAIARPANSNRFVKSFSPASPNRTNLAFVCLKCCDQSGIDESLH
jgi:hypothetical protein